MRYIISGLLIVVLAAGSYSLTKSQCTQEPLSPDAVCLEEAVIMEPLHFLVFSKTAGYRHESISAGIEALEKLAEDREWTVTASEDSTVFNDETLADI